MDKERGGIGAIDPKIVEVPVRKFAVEQGLNWNRLMFARMLVGSGGINEGDGVVRTPPTLSALLDRVRFINSFPPEHRAAMWGVGKELSPKLTT